ncbi:MAG: DUF4194 domain-containing protein [Bacillota bacterium]|nr:DUF4194 domain-containing protein [Bacillota bacterium]
MWKERFDRLNTSEKEEFKRIASQLLSKTFVVRDVYDVKENLMVINREYRFLERHFDLFGDYLFYSGWDLLKDSQYGVIYIENVYQYNKVKLDLFTTLALYTIRLIYEESRERVALRNEALTSTGELVHKMMTLNVLKKKPAAKDLAEGLRLLAYHNLIQKIEGFWEDADSKLLILPSVLFVIPNVEISRIHETLGKALTEKDEADQQEEDEGEEILRGESEGMEE